MITCFTSNTQNTRKKIVTSNFKKKIYFFMLLWLSYSEWHCVLVTLRIKVILIKFYSAQWTSYVVGAFSQICEYIFDFLKKWVLITEILKIAFLFQDFSTIFLKFWKFLINALYKHASFYMIWSWRVPLTVTRHFFIYTKVSFDKKNSMTKRNQLVRSYQLCSGLFF